MSFNFSEQSQKDHQAVEALARQRGCSYAEAAVLFANQPPSPTTQPASFGEYMVGDRPLHVNPQSLGRNPTTYDDALVLIVQLRDELRRVTAIAAGSVGDSPVASSFTEQSARDDLLVRRFMESGNYSYAQAANELIRQGAIG